MFASRCWPGACSPWKQRAEPLSPLQGIPRVVHSRVLCIKDWNFAGCTLLVCLLLLYILIRSVLKYQQAGAWLEFHLVSDDDCCKHRCDMVDEHACARVQHARRVISALLLGQIVAGLATPTRTRKYSQSKHLARGATGLRSSKPESAAEFFPVAHCCQVCTSCTGQGCVWSRAHGRRTSVR
jgi:hypothetical protein